MLLVFTSSWWALVLRVIAAILFGILAFVWPHITLTALVFLFGAYALVDGVFAIIAGVKSHSEFKRWWVLLLEGILSVIAGVLAFMLPGITALAIQMRKYITGEWMLVLAGIASLLFGIALLVNPNVGALAVIWVIGAYMIVFGVLLLSLGVKLRGLVRAAHQMTPRAV